MSKGVLISVVVVIGIVGALVLFNKDQSPADTTAQSFSAVQQEVAGGGKLYDVRTPQEFTAGHFENAINWPVQDIIAGKLPGVDKATKVYLYCESGSRAAQAAALLKDAGYTNVTNLQGLAHMQSIGGKLIR